MPAITLPDGSERQFDAPVTGTTVAEAIGPGLARAAIAMKVDGKLVDLSTLIERDADFAKFAGRIQLTYIYEEVLGWDIMGEQLAARGKLAGDLLSGVASQEVDRQDVRAAPVGGRQFVGHGLELRQAPRHQHAFMTMRAEFTRQGHANSSGGAGDQCDGLHGFAFRKMGEPK